MTASRITSNLENPEELERFYHSDRNAFEKEFMQVYPDLQGNKLAEFWKVRLDFERSGSITGKIARMDIIVLILTCVLSGILIKLPAISGMNISDEQYYLKNAGLILMLGLSVYTILTRESFKRSNIFISLLIFLVSAIYINILPAGSDNHSVILACIHLPLMLWCFYGLIYMDYDYKDLKKRMDYIRFNGDLAILSAILVIAGVILTFVTLGLFQSIEIKIEKFFMEYIGIWGLVSIPVVAAFIIRNYPFITHRIAPVVASIFSPLVLITLVAYLVSIPISGKDPYNDRDFLLIFNLMLLGVMAIIVFSVSEVSENKNYKYGTIILFALVIVTLIIDLVALSAIVYRLGEFGFSPNKTAVLGSNLLIFINLLWILADLFRVVFRRSEISTVEISISRYLPVYAVWTIIVVFGFPLIFGMK